MVILIAVSSALTVGLLVMLIAGSVPARTPGMKARIAELELDGLFSADAARHRTRRRSRLKDLLEYLGERMEERRNDWGRTRQRLVTAGYREPRALPLFLGLRLGTTGVLGLYGFLGAKAGELSGTLIIVAAILGARASSRRRCPMPSTCWSSAWRLASASTRRSCAWRRRSVTAAAR
jgi:hypothetical protein